MVSRGLEIPLLAAEPIDSAANRHKFMQVYLRWPRREHDSRELHGLHTPIILDLSLFGLVQQKQLTGDAKTRSSDEKSD